ncbi:MAG TPA: flagellin [Bacteroidetes bacterium]|nr:flagellin [Bacteroidota bacterium]
MSTRINHNIISLTAQRHLQANQIRTETAITRLSSGLRINNAWDDPAGIGISERFRAQINSMEEAERNANANMNVAATAEGALSSIDDILVRMKALSIQASNGAMTDLDRSNLDIEFQQLKSEISRIANTTSYGGFKLLDGSYSSTGIKFHIGISNVAGEDYYYVNFKPMSADDLGLSDVELTNTTSAQNAINIIDLAIDSKDAERVRIGSYVERLQQTISSYQVSREAAVKAESDIRDADIAAEMSEFTRGQLLMQTSVAMLTQANMLPQIVAGLVG